MARAPRGLLGDPSAHRRSARDARRFIGVLDRLATGVRTKGLFDDGEQRRTVLNVIAEGRAIYERIVEGDPRRSRAPLLPPPHVIEDEEPES